MNTSIPSGKKPTKIVCLVPSITEYLYALGLDSEVIGITKFCIHPAEWFRTKKRIGGTKNINTNVILNLEPDLVIANIEENIKEQVDEIAQSVPVLVTNIKTLDDAYKTLLQIAQIVDKEEKGIEIIKEIKAKFSAIKKISKSMKVAYLVWQKPYMVVGGDTFISSMLEACGLKNKFQKEKRYTSVDLDQLKDCDALLLSTEPYPFKDKHIKVLQNELQDKPNPIMLVDGEMFSWYGSRMLKAADYFGSFVTELSMMRKDNKVKNVAS